MASKKKPALRLLVGGVYMDGDGVECRIVSARPYKDQYGMRYRRSGRCESSWRSHDLIREVPAPKPARKRKAAKPVMAWCGKMALNGSIIVIDWTTHAGTVQMLACFPTRRDARKWAKQSGLAVERVEVRR